MAAAATVALCALGVALVPAPAQAATHTVAQRNLQFTPPTITVATGDTVVWTNEDTVVHSVSGGSFNSPEVPPGGTFSFTFPSAGTFNYTCRFHPDMFGTVVVQDGGGGPGPTTTTPPPDPTTTPPGTPPGTTAPPTPPPGGGSTPTSGGGAPIGLGPLPVSFDLTDANGSWFDTNLNLGPSIGQSLAVAVLPRVNLGSVLNGVPAVNPSGLPLVGGGGLPNVGGLLPGGGGLPALPDLGGGGLPALPGLPDLGGGGLPDVGGLLPGGGALPDVGGLLPSLGGGLPGLGDIPLLGGGSLPLLDGGSVPLLGGGLLGGVAGARTLNSDLLGSLPDLTGGQLPVLGNLGVDLNSLLNLDATRQAIFQLLPTGDARIAQANSLLDQLTTQLSALPVDAPVSLSSLPVGAELQDLLKNLQDFADNDVALPVTVNFNISQPTGAASAHTATGLIWPEGAKGFPQDQPGAFVGSTSMQLTEPGLYAFACKIHPYMLGAVVVDDPLTIGLDFGKRLHVNSRGLNVPSNADIIAQLVQKFFVITVPENWQTFSDTEDRVWNPQFPPAPILTYDENGSPELIPSLDAYFKSKFEFPKTLPALGKKPAVPGVGEVWVATQMEEYAEKTKTGSVTRVDTQTWNVAQKVALPEINMNNTHNMWTDKDETVIYANEWFNDKMDVFDRKTGKLIRQLQVGPDPSHVMSRTDTDQLHVAINGGGAVMEIAPGGTRIDRRLAVQTAGEKIAHPHAHWMTGDATLMATPNVNLHNATLVDIPTGNIRHEQTGELPIATGMTPDGSKTYMADFLGATVSCISNRDDACKEGSATVKNKRIDLWGSYDAEAGASGPFGGLPIQLPVAPDNSALLVANTLTSNITVIDPKTDEIVKWLPCDAGCHGINYGAKKGGGYYAYVSSKFANTLAVIDPDPNLDGNPEDAAVVGKFVLDGTSATTNDATITKWAGFGGQGVLPIPLAYEGWVQRVPSNAVNDQLTCRQRNPVDFATACR